MYKQIVKFRYLRAFISMNFDFRVITLEFLGLKLVNFHTLQ